MAKRWQHPRPLETWADRERRLGSAAERGRERKGKSHITLTHDEKKLLSPMLVLLCHARINSSCRFECTERGNFLLSPRDRRYVDQRERPHAKNLEELVEFLSDMGIRHENPSSTRIEVSPQHSMLNLILAALPVLQRIHTALRDDVSETNLKGGGRIQGFNKRDIAIIGDIMRACQKEFGMKPTGIGFAEPPQENPGKRSR